MTAVLQNKDNAFVLDLCMALEPSNKKWKLGFSTGERNMLIEQINSSQREAEASAELLDPCVERQGGVRGGSDSGCRPPCQFFFHLTNHYLSTPAVYLTYCLFNKIEYSES